MTDASFLGGAALPGPIDPPTRLLMGPGPISAYPSVLRAMSAPLVGQYDPFMTATMTETQELYRAVWATRNDATLLVDGTSRAGIEAAIFSLEWPINPVSLPTPLETRTFPRRTPASTTDMTAWRGSAGAWQMHWLTRTIKGFSTATSNRRTCCCCPTGSPT